MIVNRMFSWCGCVAKPNQTTPTRTLSHSVTALVVMKKLSLLPSDLDTKCSTPSLMSMMGFFVASFVLCSVVFSVSIVLRDPPSDAALHEPSSLAPLLQITQTLRGSYLFLHCCFARYKGSTFFTFLSHPICLSYKISLSLTL